MKTRTLTEIVAALEPGQSIEIVRSTAAPDIVSLHIEAVEQLGPRRVLSHHFSRMNIAAAHHDIVCVELDKHIKAVTR